jgi:hypothetical protein
MSHPAAVPVEAHALLDAFILHLTNASRHFQGAATTPQSFGSITTGLLSKHAAYRHALAEAEAALLALEAAMRAWPPSKKPLDLLFRGIRIWTDLIENSIEVNSIILANSAERKKRHLEALWAENRTLAQRVDELLEKGTQLLEMQFHISIDMKKIFPS